MEKNLINHMINTIYIVDPHVQQQVYIKEFDLIKLDSPFSFNSAFDI
jgi:hypothetical protein